MSKPITIALVDDYDVVLLGVAHIIDRYRDRVLIAEIDTNKPLHDTVDIVLYDSTVSRTFATEHLAGKGMNSPYLGRALPGKVLHTFRHGYATVLDGSVVDAATVAASGRAARG